MPYVRVSSNVSKASVDANAVVRALSKAVSEALSKPEQYVMAQLELDVPMLFQGTDAVRSLLSNTRCLRMISVNR